MEKGRKENKAAKSEQDSNAKNASTDYVGSALTASEIDLLDKAKLQVEIEKIKLEKDKMLVASLTEDFKARWQELLNFENENSRWQTLYVTALILVISWVLSNSGQEGKYGNIGELFRGENSYFLLSLALINAVYTLAMAYKGYQIQEIAQYLFTRIGNNISPRIGTEFNSWERWRRDETGSPTLVRTIFYFIIGILPTAVSGTILILYFNYEWAHAPTRLNWFAIFVSLFVLMTLLTALWTMRMNAKWNIILGSKSKR